MQGSYKYNDWIRDTFKVLKQRLICSFFKESKVYAPALKFNQKRNKKKHWKKNLSMVESNQYIEEALPFVLFNPVTNSKCAAQPR